MMNAASQKVGVHMILYFIVDRISVGEVLH